VHLRPRGPYRQAVILLLLAGTLTLIARTSGSGWAMVIVSGLVAVVAVGVLWPLASLAMATVELSLPRDATVGRGAEGTIRVRRTRSDVRIRLTDPPSAWYWSAPPTDGSLVVTPVRRGVLPVATVELWSAAPVGLLWWRRTISMPLEVEMEIAPSPLAVNLPQVLAGAIGDVRPAQRRSGNDSVRTVREYVTGDPTRLVHWGHTARRGELMVKELEDPEGSLLVVVVDLRGDDEDAERAASQAAGLCLGALRDGVRTQLVTTEVDGVHAGRVATSIEVGRRLARAVAGRPADHHVPGGATVVLVSARHGIVVRHA
jgi:uncharacterized protein (DUF58 family)